MTDKEIKKIRNEIPQFENGISCRLTPQQEKLHKELDCRNMINSCLCYGYDFMESNYSKPYIEELGKERVLELYNEQEDDFEKATIIHSVYEDGEGNSYNSIKWADEVEKGGNEIEI